MNRFFLLGFAGAVIGHLGCGGTVSVEGSGAAGAGGTSASAGGVGGASSSSSAGGGAGGGSTTGSGGSGGGGGTSWVKELSGHYMRQSIGNCINVEEWLSFSPPNDVVETIVDRNYCGSHSVSARKGTSLGESDQRLSLVWASAGMYASRRFTAAIVTSYPYGPGPDPAPGYEQGKGALNDKVYVQREGDLLWHRESKWVYPADPQGKKRTKLFLADVRFDETIDGLGGPAACQMTIHLHAAVYYDEPADPPGKADEEGGADATLPCSYGPDSTGPWVRLTANGFENSDYDGSWTDYLGKLGVWDKTDGEVESQLWEEFRPIFYYELFRPAVLFHDVSFAWYPNMKSPPPEKVE